MGERGRRYRISAFGNFQCSIVKHRPRILASLEHGLSNGRIGSMTTQIRLIIRIVFGFKSPEAPISPAMLSAGGHKPVLPGRTFPTDMSGARSMPKARICRSPYIEESLNQPWGQFEGSSVAEEDARPTGIAFEVHRFAVFESVSGMGVA